MKSYTGATYVRDVSTRRVTFLPLITYIWMSCDKNCCINVTLRIMLIIKKLVKIDHINSYVYKILQLNFFKIIYICNINLRVTLTDATIFIATQRM